MAIPLKKGYKFRVEHVTKPASNYMPSFDIYEKYYGIGYLVKGDRQVSTPSVLFSSMTDTSHLSAWAYIINHHLYRTGITRFMRCVLSAR